LTKPFIDLAELPILQSGDSYGIRRKLDETAVAFLAFTQCLLGLFERGNGRADKKDTGLAFEVNWASRDQIVNDHAVFGSELQFEPIYRAFAQFFQQCLVILGTGKYIQILWSASNDFFQTVAGIIAKSAVDLYIASIIDAIDCDRIRRQIHDAAIALFAFTQRPFHNKPLGAIP